MGPTGPGETASATGTPNCPYCGMIHSTKCPMVKAYEYEGGAIKRVEFFSPGDYAAHAAQVVYGPNGTHPWWPNYRQVIS